MVTKTKTKPPTESKRKPDLIEVAEARMNGTQERAITSMKSYRETWVRFLEFLGHPATFSSIDVDRYAAKRRRDGISKRTLRKEFYHLKALASCNNVEWTFLKYDIPHDRIKALTPTINPDVLEQLILSQFKFTGAEKFYLAIATVFGCRREAMAQMNKRDFDDQTITIRGVHGGETVKHAIPEVIAPILQNCWPGEHGVTALSIMFNRMCRKAGIKLEKGFGWHSVRRCVTSVMRYVLPANQLEESYWSEFTGWSKKSEGQTFMGSAMMGHYTHPEVLNSEFMQKLKILTADSHGNDPYWMDHSIYLVHPFLKVWETALKPKAKPKPTPNK